MEENLKTPSVSVVMAVYNAERFLKVAVNSILNQTYSDFELICVNDGSKDHSLKILESINDPRLIILNNDANRGIVYSANRGIDAARAQLIARFDSDDISHPDRLKKQVEYMNQHPEMAMCSSFIRQIDIYGNPAGFWPSDISADTPEKIRKLMPYDNCVAQPASMIRASVIKSYRYRLDMNISEDWGMWLEMLSDGLVIGKITEYLIDYRIVPNSFTHGHNAKGPYRKIIRFQIQYLKSRIKRKKIHSVEWNVFLSLLLNIARYPFRVWLRPFLHKVKLALSRKPWNFLKMLSDISKLPDNMKVAFFFPYYHTGGAEHVHFDIVNSVSHENPVIFFTSKSSDDKYREQFDERASCIDISDFADFPVLNKFLLKRIASKLNSSSCHSVFSSNCHLYYQLLPYLRSDIKKCDLVHAFVHDLEDGPEKWSLPVVKLLDKRVFVSNHALLQMRDFYRKNNIPVKFADRLLFIRNAVETAPSLPVKGNDPFEIIYIGRAGTEKRVPIILKAAEKFINNSSVRFTLIGDVEGLVPDHLKHQVRLPGMLYGNSLKHHLQEAHILVLTSLREGMPIVIMEAMANGVVPVSTAVGDVPEYVRNNETGFLLPVMPEEAVADALAEKIIYLKANRTELQRMAENAYHLAKDLFSEEKFKSDYRSLLLSEK